MALIGRRDGRNFGYGLQLSYAGLHDRTTGSARHQPLSDASVQLDKAVSVQRWVGAGEGRRKT